MGISNGQTTKELAATLGISPKTVELHRTRLRRSFGARTVPHLVKLALEQGVLTT